MGRGSVAYTSTNSTQRREDIGQEHKGGLGEGEEERRWEREDEGRIGYDERKEGRVEWGGGEERGREAEGREKEECRVYE